VLVTGAPVLGAGALGDVVGVVAVVDSVGRLDPLAGTERAVLAGRVDECVDGRDDGRVDGGVDSPPVAGVLGATLRLFVECTGRSVAEPVGSGRTTK
jgi:hypothetical protein